MGKVSLIIAREYFARTKKVSFIITALFVPILLVLLMVAPVYVANQSEKKVTVYVCDESSSYLNKFSNLPKVEFVYPGSDLFTMQKQCIAGECDAVLQILGGTQSNQANLYFYNEPPISLQSKIEKQMDNITFDKILRDTFNINLRKYNALKQSCKTSIVSLQIDEAGKAQLSMQELNRIVGLVCGILIYLFVFLYANQVLQSTLEEKSNRIVEIIISSVKPLEFMMGKIVGVALVAITQFLLQIVSVVLILLAVQFFLPSFLADSTAVDAVATQSLQMESAANYAAGSSLMQDISDYYSFPFSTIIICFFFYFLFGYLMYASLFAGVGSATDTDTDSQQLIFPLTIPLLLALVIVTSTSSMQSELLWWLSIIPFTSPIAMLFRLPSGVPAWELAISMGLLLLFFVIALWFSAKVFRTGVLMYGKKSSWRELWKWFRMP